jgi:hypothetical protein
MKKKIILILKILLVIVIVIFGVWLSIGTNFNLGRLISNILKGKDETIKNPVDFNNVEIGKTYTIKENSNPLRDKSIVELDNGQLFELPKNTIDSEVSKITVIDQGVAHVVKKDGTVLTSVFDS